MYLFITHDGRTLEYAILEDIKAFEEKMVEECESFIDGYRDEIICMVFKNNELVFEQGTCDSAPISEEKDLLDATSQRAYKTAQGNCRRKREDLKRQETQKTKEIRYNQYLNLKKEFEGF